MKKNPYVKQFHPSFPQHGIFFYHPVKGLYCWTGGGVKPCELRYDKTKEFVNAEQAEAELPKVRQHIREWKTEFEPYLLGE